MQLTQTHFTLYNLTQTNVKAKLKLKCQIQGDPRNMTVARRLEGRRWS